jgi:hypothetical protein
VRSKEPFTMGVRAFVISVFAIVAVFLSTSGLAARPHGAKPLMKVLPLFTAPDVPKMGPAETAAPPLKESSQFRPDCPEKGWRSIPCSTWARGTIKFCSSIAAALFGLIQPGRVGVRRRLDAY